MRHSFARWPRPATGRWRASERARLRQWTARSEARFLAVLAATCNVKAACAEAGLTAASAYNHAKRWPRFGALWDQAVAIGYSQIEAQLLCAGAAAFGAEDLEVEEALPAMTAAQAIHLLHMHKHQVHGVGKAPGQT